MTGKTERVRKTVDRFSPYDKDDKAFSHREILRFIAEVEAVSPTHPDWKGAGIEANRMELAATESQRKEVNEIGAIHGCHSCLSDVSTDPDQPWIGDHSPPTALSPAARKALNLPDVLYDGTIQLRPQCDACSATQSSLVKRVNSEVAQGLKPNLNKLGEILLGIKPGKHAKGVNATGATVSPAQGDSIQRLGGQYGCHSCGEKFAKDYYHADHNPPVCYTYSHVIAILKYARDNIKACKHIEVSQDFVLKPQCPRCSHEQGGKMRGLSDEARDLAQRMGLAVY